MAVTIIGAKAPTTEAFALPRAEVDLPSPASAPAGRLLFDHTAIEKLLVHPSPIVRTFGLEQIALRLDEDFDEAVLRLLDDEDPEVLVEAIAILSRRKCARAVDAFARIFEKSFGEVAASAATALGRLDPARLLTLVKAKGRLDDEAYAATATALATVGSPEVIEFLDRALNRAGALSPERRGTLYGASLLSGNVELASRILTLAIADSERAEPEGSAFPTRAALGAMAGVPLGATGRGAGLELFDHAREILEKVVLPALGEAERSALSSALEKKRAGDVVTALLPVLSIASQPKDHAPIAEDGDLVEELGSMFERRRGLLRALGARADGIGKLELKASALFVAAAAKAAIVLVAGRADEASSEGLVAMSKALEGERSAEQLAAMSLEDLTELFRSKSPRLMRRVLAVLTRETFRRSRTLTKFAKAAILGGHAKDLLEALGDTQQAGVHDPILDAFAECVAPSEAAVVEIFAEHPLPEKTLPYALAVAEDLRTERVGLAIARRFYDLRDHGRAAVARTLMRVGDPRFIPLLESRAYRREPEEIAWAILSSIHGAPLEGRLAAAHDSARNAAAEEGVVLPLRCKRCKEVLTYLFERVFVDPEAKDAWGDPAFAGEVKCKACGLESEPFESTDAAVQILSQHMLELLSERRMGRPGSGLVLPGLTQVGGRRMGFAAALRQLDQDVAASPDGIRIRLHRARIRMMLARPSATDDLDKVLDLDPASIEALMLRASVRARNGDYGGAAADLVSALRRIAKPEDVRLYDHDDITSLKVTVEDLLLDMKTMGAEVPADIDLSASQGRLRERAAKAQTIDEDRWEREDDEGPAQELQAEGAQRAKRAEAHSRNEAQASWQEGDVPKAGRNDPCPCGSGKKYKKCHGSR
jgi:hypothetical protein